MMPPLLAVFVVLLTAVPLEVQSTALPPLNSLPPGLQDTTVDYPESRETFVHFPAETKGLLDREMAKIHSPLVLDVVTSVTHWKDPVWALLKGLVHRFRNQNQIIYVRAHYYVGNGLTEQGCRVEYIDSDTGVQTERPVDSDTCRDQCTNGGRYCTPEVPEFTATVTGLKPKAFVEETLRRLCIDDLYHASDLKHWEYLEAFEEMSCVQQADMAMCSKISLAQVFTTDWSAVQDCVQLAGGLDDDVMNVRLQEQLDRQQGSYSLAGVPMMHIAGKPYTGPWEVSSILTSVCHAYQEVYDVTPIACDFCSPCQDVRKCLWYMECDGTPFSLDTFQQGAFTTLGQTTTTAAPVDATKPPETASTDAPQSTPPPPPTTPAPAGTAATANAPQDTPPSSTTTTEPPQDSSSSKQEDDETNTTGFFIGGILAGLVFGLAPALYFAQHEKRTRREISAALAAREQSAFGQDGAYHDDLETSFGKSRPTQEELQNMEDVTLEDNIGGSTGEYRDTSPYKDNPRSVRFPVNKIV